MLTRPVTRPVRHVEDEAPDLGGFVDPVNEVRYLPGQSPA
jgi:hypothetical protein